MRVRAITDMITTAKSSCRMLLLLLPWNFSISSEPLAQALASEVLFSTLKDPGDVDCTFAFDETNHLQNPVLWRNGEINMYNGPRKLDREIRWKDGPGPS